MRDEIRETLLGALVGSRNYLQSAIAAWERLHGSRAGLSAALLELEGEGYLRLRTAVGGGEIQVLDIESVNARPGTEMASSSRSDSNPDRDARQVFVVHGQNVKVRDSTFEFLRAIDLRPVEWIELIRKFSSGSPYIGQLLDFAFAEAQAVIVLMTPDEEVALSSPTGPREIGRQARPNVIFEAGMALAHDADHTVIVEVGTLRPFSDIAGRHIVRLDDDDLDQRVGLRQDLAQRLERMGCPVKLTGTSWHTTGSFRI